MPIPPKGLKVLAPAKINLTLEILGKRSDGYHEIRSLMQRISLFDLLWIEAGSDGLEVHCPGHPELENDGNLISRAIRLLEKEIDRPLSFTIRLMKRIPIGGGLGGGSSDAAAVLSNINLLLGSPVQPEHLGALAAQAGSDIPFFLNNRTALALGRGERIVPWPAFPVWWYVLICPAFSISTSWAYSQVKLPLTPGKETINIDRLKERGEIPGKDRFKNDLEENVLPSFPILKEIKQALLDQRCLQALMSGSGSTVFGIWEDRVKAAQAFHNLKRQGWGKVFLVKGL
ncbi:MAG: 4-(cytidine 5'-diphospho)-2-C-methyl-D-erythritol kinase [Desulfobacca sp.]|nr:4-(cytidine 5'-diphospho)-2-C-methyl-D-erythritol kinase [Desulfobacca sp.]